MPSALEGIHTDVVDIGDVRALQTPPSDRQKKWRPAPPGVSIGHYKITAGTFGCVVKNKDGADVVLSNNHVLADSNDGEIGDRILQPGPYDGGRITDVIGTLEAFVPISFGNGASWCPIANMITRGLNFLARLFHRQTRMRATIPHAENNLVDVAIASVNAQDITPDILDVGIPTGTKPGALGMEVTKSGRTTGLTVGHIRYTNAAVKVNYGGSRIAQFTNQLIIEPGGFSAGGDSGSAVVTVEGGVVYLVGLLFAGSRTHTIINTIENVFNALDLSL